MSPAGGGRGWIGRIDISGGSAINHYILFPPPSLRDTSASGGYEVTFFLVLAYLLAQSLQQLFRRILGQYIVELRTVVLNKTHILHDNVIDFPFAVL